MALRNYGFKVRIAQHTEAHAHFQPTRSGLERIFDLLDKALSSANHDEAA